MTADWMVSTGGFFTLVGQSCLKVKILLISCYFFFFEGRREETGFNCLVIPEILFNAKINGGDCVTFYQHGLTSWK
jgi:hypothetical protein